MISQKYLTLLSLVAFNRMYWHASPTWSTFIYSILYSNNLDIKLLRLLGKQYYCKIHGEWFDELNFEFPKQLNYFTIQDTLN